MQWFEPSLDKMGPIQVQQRCIDDMAEHRGSSEHRPLVFRPALPMVPVDPGRPPIIRPETLVRWHRAGFHRKHAARAALFGVLCVCESLLCLV